MHRLTHPEFVARLASVHGDALLPLGKYQCYRTKIDVRCLRCDHEWRVIPASLLGGSGCPECGKITARDTPKHPQAAARFEHRLHGRPITAMTPYRGATEPIRVRCMACSHEWDTTPARLRTYGCLPCGHQSKGAKLRKTPAEFERQVANIHDDKLRILGTYTTSKARIDVECTQCGHQWTPVAGRLIRGEGRGCPRCWESKGERQIVRVLEGHGVSFTREHTFRDLVGPKGGRLRFDFAVWSAPDSMSHLIEYDGAHHFRALKHRGGVERFRQQKQHDKMKNDYCALRGIPLVRIHHVKLADIDIGMLQCPSSR